MNFVRRLVFIVGVLWGNVFILQAQEPAVSMLHSAKESLKQGDIKNAQRFYDVYKKAVGRDKDFEERLQEYIENQDTTSMSFNVDGFKFKMIYVEGGEFRMGGTEGQGGDVNEVEMPVHRVRLTDYYIGQWEVTQGLWTAVMGTTIEQQRDKEDPNLPLYGVGATYPMYYVSWEEAFAFCRELSRMTGKVFSLPTEAQWEYAARGGKKSVDSKYSGSFSIEKVAFYANNSNASAQPVGQKMPNELGIYDMSGNVWEWCWDWMGNYLEISSKNPQGPANGSYRVLRGGSWDNREKLCRVSNRGSNNMDSRCYNNGFRIVLLLDPQANVKTSNYHIYLKSR